MKALFCIFSGTGNTLRVGERLANELVCYGIESDIYRIREDSPPPEILQYELIIFGYPVHAFNAPTAILKFLKKLPRAQKKNVYIIRTSGEPLKLNDASGITPVRILRKRGYNILGEFSYVMPYNIIFRHSDKMAARMWQCAVRMIQRDAQTIADFGGSLRKNNVFRRAVAFTLRIEHAAMPLLGRTFRVNKKLCIGCGKCVLDCPKSNIVMKNGRPKFKGSCVGCMACAFGCPKDAIRISLLNGWRVNGGYSFDGDPASDDEVCGYCHNSYINYFHLLDE